METILERESLTVFDLETTGFDPEKGAEIIEVGAVKLRAGEVEEEFQEFVQPRRSIPTEIQELTGISNEDVEDADFYEQVLERFIDFLGEDVLVAHNMPFDLSFLEHYTSDPIENPTIDTLTICRAVGAFSSNKLDHITKKLGIERDRAHRAHHDARATAELCGWIAPNVKSIDDYRRCEIPHELVADDPEIVFPELPLISGKTIANLRDHYDSVNGLRQDLADSSSPEFLSTADRENIEEFFRDWDDRENLYDYLRDRGRGGTILNGLDVSYWTVVNWFWNGAGLALLGGAVVGTRSTETFTRLVLLAVPCLLTSLAVIHFRNQSHGLLKQWGSGLLFFAITLFFLW